MAIPPRPWVPALAQGFLDMPLPARRLASASVTCCNGAPPLSTDMIWKYRRVIEIGNPLRGEMDKLPPVWELCNYTTPQYESLERASATWTRWFGPAVSSPPAIHHHSPLRWNTECGCLAPKYSQLREVEGVLHRDPHSPQRDWRGPLLVSIFEHCGRYRHKRPWHGSLV